MITIVKLRVNRLKDLQFNAVRLKNILPFKKNSTAGKSAAGSNWPKILTPSQKINIDKGSAPVLVHGVSGGLRKTRERAFKEVSKEIVKFGYIFIFTEPKLYSPDITGRTNRSFSLQPDLLIVELQQGMSIRIISREDSGQEH